MAIVIVYIAVFSGMVVSLSSLILHEYRFTKRAAARLQALYGAESGIDLALCEMNKTIAGKKAWNGWSQSNGFYRLSATPGALRAASAPAPELEVEVDIAGLTIKSSATIRLPLFKDAITRTVVVSLARRDRTYSISQWKPPTP